MARSKWEGEEAVRSRLAEHIIVRTSWLYGSRGLNFVKTMLRLGREREELKVVSDQYGCPTWSFDLAGCLVRIAERALFGSEEAPRGTFHFCGEGVTTWYEFALAILDEAQAKGIIADCQGVARAEQFLPDRCGQAHVLRARLRQDRGEFWNSASSLGEESCEPDG